MLGAKFNLCAGAREILMMIDVPCVLFFNALFLLLHFPFVALYLSTKYIAYGLTL
jgi:hypothetical protein